MLGITDGNRRSKAAVKRSSSKRASSWVGYNVPPPSTGSVTRQTYNRDKPVVQCGRGRPYYSYKRHQPCLPGFAAEQTEDSRSYLPVLTAKQIEDTSLASLGLQRSRLKIADLAFLEVDRRYQPYLTEQQWSRLKMTDLVFQYWQEQITSSLLPEVAVERIEDSKSRQTSVEQVEATSLISLKLQWELTEDSKCSLEELQILFL
ncbi:hypothetical protein Gotur_033373 [Gossypium turneri]